MGHHQDFPALVVGFYTRTSTSSSRQGSLYRDDDVPIPSIYSLRYDFQQALSEYLTLLRL